MDLAHKKARNLTKNPRIWFFVKFRAFLFLNMPCLYFIILVINQYTL